MTKEGLQLLYSKMVQPILTCWGTGLNTDQHYCRYYDSFEGLVREIYPSDSLCFGIVQDCFLQSGWSETWVEY